MKDASSESKEAHQVRDLLGPAEAPERVLALEHLHDVRGEVVGQQRRHDVPGAHRVDPQPLRSVLRGGVPGDADDAVLGRRVRAVPDGGHAAVDGGHCRGDRPRRLAEGHRHQHERRPSTSPSRPSAADAGVVLYGMRYQIPAMLAAGAERSAIVTSSVMWDTPRYPQEYPPGRWRNPVRAGGGRG